MSETPRGPWWLSIAVAIVLMNALAQTYAAIWSSGGATARLAGTAVVTYAVAAGLAAYRWLR